MIWKGALCFGVEIDGVVTEGCDVVGIRLVDFGAMVLELDSLLGGCFCLELGSV